MTNTSDWKTLEEQIKDIATNKLDDGWNTCALTRKQIQDILALIDHIVLTEVIGKNEPETIEMGRRIFSVARNKLRASQRENYKALKGGK